MTRAKLIMFALLAVASLLAQAPAGWAQDTQWNVSSGEWKIPEYWTAGAPTSTMEAWINNGGSAYLTGTPGSARRS